MPKIKVFQHNLLLFNNAEDLHKIYGGDVIKIEHRVLFTCPNTRQPALIFPTS